MGYWAKIGWTNFNVFSPTFKTKTNLIYLPFSRILYTIPTPALYKDPLIIYKILVFQSFFFHTNPSFLLLFLHMFIHTIQLTKEYTNIKTTTSDTI